MNPQAAAMSRLRMAVIAVVLFAQGCASTDVNPRVAQPRTGYVDFYADDSSGLCWQIQRLEPDQLNGKTIFEEFKPRTNDILRLAFAPGTYRFAVTFLNRAIIEPGTAIVSVEDGKVTPVQVTLEETGKALIETRQERMGASYARTGRTTKVRASEGATFRVAAEAEHPMAYRPKEALK